RVLDRVVEKGAGEGDVVEAELGQDQRDTDRVGDVGVARTADLVTVRFARDVVRVLDERRLGLRGLGAVLRQWRAPRRVDRARMAAARKCLHLLLTVHKRLSAPRSSLSNLVPWYGEPGGRTVVTGRR